jgi:uncharacterized membrane protein YoaK (UPF0700 family)
LRSSASAPQRQTSSAFSSHLPCLQFNCAVAIVGYIAGCAGGARISGIPADSDPVWPPAVTWGLGVEAGLFLLSASGWCAVGGRPRGLVTAGLLGLSALALGIQSSTVKRFGESGPSTTYLTGTLTTLVIRLATGGRFRDVTRHLCLLLALLTGAAAATTLLALNAFAFVPLMQLVPLAAVIVVATTAARRHTMGPEPE